MLPPRFPISKELAVILGALLLLLFVTPVADCRAHASLHWEHALRPVAAGHPRSLADRPARRLR